MKPKIGILYRYPTSINYLTTTIADGMLYELGHENIYIKPFNCKVPYSDVTDDMVSQHHNAIELKDCNVIIYGEAIDGYDNENVKSLEIIKEIKSNLTKNQVFVIVNDKDTNGYPSATKLFNESINLCDLYYLKDKKVDSIYNNKVKFLNLAAFSLSVPTGDRNILARFRGTYSGRDRENYMHRINSVFNNTICFEPRLRSTNEFAAELASTLIGVSLDGHHGNTSLRYFEIPYFGALLATEKHHSYIENDFIPDEECIIFDSAEELYEKVMRLDKDRNTLERIRLNGQKAVNLRHLTKHRAQQVLKDLGEHYDKV